MHIRGDVSLPAAAAKLLQSCPTLCDPIDGSPPGSTVPGILQARTLEWDAISFSYFLTKKQSQSEDAGSKAPSASSSRAPGRQVLLILPGWILLTHEASLFAYVQGPLRISMRSHPSMLTISAYKHPSPGATTGVPGIHPLGFPAETV